MTTKSLAEGALWFLQWDQLNASVAALVWSTKLWRSAHQAQRVRYSILGLAVKVVLLSLVAGVSGSVVELMWERDELLLQEAGETEEKKRR
jgi:hypothetical protein